MKFLITALLVAQTVAFTSISPISTASSTSLFLENRINESIDLESPKVATMETLEGKTKKVYCRCWQSGTFPLCDGSHVKHNEKNGDNVGPLIVTVKAPEA
jgi:CDGSH-type Zn-finger protein